tara:strand:+ start:807 stop:1001 length:195 start_codon:yes stop_codon:yes gene_type:complete
MDGREELVWKFLLKIKHEPIAIEDLAEHVEKHCDVTKDYAQGIIDRIGTPWEVFQEKQLKQQGR